MSRFIKEWLLFVYWLPRITRCLWRESRGGFFIFRDEPDELLRFLHSYLYVLRDSPEDPLFGFYQRALIEIRDRERRKALRDSLRSLGY